MSTANTEINTLEVLSSDSLERIERAQTDIQISTAKRYPRTMSVVKKDMMDLATLDTETAASCFYTLSRKVDGGVKLIQGPSARLAEIAVNAFGNIKAGAQIIGNDGKTITARAVCHDLEKNVCMGVEVKRRITNRDGKTYSEDMQVVTGNAACSIALRNAVFKVIPMALVKPVYEAAKKAAVGDAKTLTDRRKAALAAFKELGISESRVFSAVGIKGVEDIGLGQLEILIGMHTAIKDGDSTAEELFPSHPAFTAPKPLLKSDKPAPTPKTAHPTPASDDGDVAPQEPAAGTPAPQPESTPQGELEHLMTTSHVPFDDFRDFVRVKGLAKDTDSWTCYAEVPSSVIDKLTPKMQADCIRTYGKVQQQQAA